MNFDNVLVSSDYLYYICYIVSEFLREKRTPRKIINLTSIDVPAIIVASKVSLLFL